MEVPQSCPSLWDPVDYTVHGILQARVLEWVAYPFSRGPSRPRNTTCHKGPHRQPEGPGAHPRAARQHKDPDREAAAPLRSELSSPPPPLSLWASQVARWQRIHLQMQAMQAHGFDPCIRKLPCRREWQSTPVFLPGKTHRQRSLAGYKVHGATESWA